MILLFAFISCEKSDLSKSDTVNPSEEPILPRGDCEDCPDEDECCCFIMLDEPDENASIYICGVSDGTPSCLGSNICGTYVAGDFKSALLTPMAPRMEFCIDENTPFYLYNYSGSDVANVIISCQRGLLNPQLVPVQLDPDESFYYETTGSCAIEPCL